MWYFYLLGGYYLIGVTAIAVSLYRNPEYKEIFSKETFEDISKSFYEETRLT
jgi:hypothetical protein